MEVVPLARVVRMEPAAVVLMSSSVSNELDKVCQRNMLAAQPERKHMVLILAACDSTYRHHIDNKLTETERRSVDYIQSDLYDGAGDEIDVIYGEDDSGEPVDDFGRRFVI